MQIVQAGKTHPLDPAALLAAASAYPSCLLDIGTGDGRFVYRYAREHPETFSIGLDPVREAFREMSAKAGKKPARGGLPNVLYLVGSVEELPAGLAGLADTVTFNYPWGSLLRALSLPAPDILEAVAVVMKPAARFTILFNLSVFEDRELADRLTLPPLSPERAEGELVPAYHAAGLAIEDIRTLDDSEVPHRTSWGQHLVLGSKRKTLLVAGTRLAG